MARTVVAAWPATRKRAFRATVRPESTGRGLEATSRGEGGGVRIASVGGRIAAGEATPGSASARPLGPGCVVIFGSWLDTRVVVAQPALDAEERRRDGRGGEHLHLARPGSGAGTAPADEGRSPERDRGEGDARSC